MKHFTQTEKSGSKKRKSLQKRIRKWIAWSHKLSQVISAEQSNLKLLPHKNLSTRDNACNVVVVIPPGSTDNKDFQCGNLKGTSNLSSSNFVDKVTFEPRPTDFLDASTSHDCTSNCNAKPYLHIKQEISATGSFSDSSTYSTQTCMCLKKGYLEDVCLASRNCVQNTPPDMVLDKQSTISPGVNLHLNDLYMESTKEGLNGLSNTELVIDNGYGIYYYCLNDSDLVCNVKPDNKVQLA